MSSNTPMNSIDERSENPIGCSECRPFYVGLDKYIHLCDLHKALSISELLYKMLPLKPKEEIEMSKSKKARKAAKLARKEKRKAEKAERKADRAETKHRARTIALAYKHLNPTASNDDVAHYVRQQMRARYGNVMTILAILQILAKLFAMFSDLDDEATRSMNTSPYPPYDNN